MKKLTYILSTYLIFLSPSVNLMAKDFSLNSSDKTLDYNNELPVYKWIKLKAHPKINIPIYKSEGTQGPSVLFIHGNASSSRAFHKQINSELGRRYKLFFLDLPGHGLASKVDSKQPMPKLENSDLPAGFKEYQDGAPEAVKLVANDPEIQAQIIVGWSLGGHIAIKAHSLGYLPLVKGLFIFGTAPATRFSPISEQSFKSYSAFDSATGMPLLPSLGLSFKLTLNSNLFTLNSKFTDRLPWYTPTRFSFFPNRGYAYLKAFFDPNFNFGFGRDIPEFVRQDGFERSDDRFRTSLAVLALELNEKNKDLPTELDYLKQIAKENITLGVAMGENDMFINLDYLKALKNQGYLKTLWKNDIQILKNSGHAPQLEQALNFNELINEFINSITF